jgi:hypothetical protein
MCLTSLCLAAQLRVESYLEPPGTTVVGETVLLQVDVLTDTWFSSAPQLPTLELANAIVSAPSSEARHLNVTRDGKPFFGLQFSYRITPTGAGNFIIAPMSISATPGQSDTQQTVATAPLDFRVEQPSGVAEGQRVLVARNLTITQEVTQSRDTLGLGDSVRREVRQTADGAEMMLLAASVFAEIEGLKRYVEQPQLKMLSDGRGNVTGGERLDIAHYIVERSGDFQLPVISVGWWDTGSRQLRSAELPAVKLTASGKAFTSPFSVTEDLKSLGQHGQTSLVRHGLALSLGGIILGLMVYLGMPWARRGRQRFQQYRALRREQWIASPRYALRMIPEQLHADPPRLDALYLWARRQYGATGLGALKDRLPSDMTRLVYGREPHVKDALNELERSLVLKQPRSARLHFRSCGLQPLNPRPPCAKE